MRILLIYPGWTQAGRLPGRPPLGLAYLAAAVPEHQCMVVDQQLPHEPVEALAAGFRPDVIGVSVSSWSFRQVQGLLRQLRQACPAALYVAGGPHPTALPEETLRAGFDAVVRGYGEETFRELVDALAGGRDLETVAGVSLVARAGEIRHAPARRYTRTLDQLSPPLYRTLNLAGYEWCSVASSRGCPAGCLFCADSHLFGRGIMLRDPEGFVGELEMLHRQHGVRRFYLIDEQFTFPKERADRICERLIEKGLDIEWQANLRVDRVSEDLLLKMKQAGCISVSFGVESGSDAILKRVHKGTNRSKIAAAIAAAKRAGLRVKTSWIVGLPGSLEEQLESIDLMRQTEPDYIDVYLLSIYPGTPLWQSAEQYGIWVDRDEIPFTAPEKLYTDRYRLDYLTKEQIIEVGHRIREAMLAQGYQVSETSAARTENSPKVITTFLESLKGSTSGDAQECDG